MDRIAGHTQGVRSVRTCVETALEAGVKYLSLFAFSEENWSRPQSEVNGLMDLMVKGIKQEKGNFAEMIAKAVEGREMKTFRVER